MNKYHGHRKSKKDNPEVLFLLLIAFIILSFFNPPMLQMLIKFWYIYFFAFVCLVIWISNKIYHYYKLSKANIDEVDNMSGPDFELFLCSLFRKLGYEVIHTGKSGDLGCDLTVLKDGVRTAVQAKRYKGNVGPDAVQEVVAALKPKNCTIGIVVTNSNYTEEAKFLANSNNIILWNRDELVNNILKTQEKTNSMQEPHNSVENPLCPICNSVMVKRSGKYGEFWGCSRYPQCQGTKDISL